MDGFKILKATCHVNPTSSKELLLLHLLRLCLLPLRSTCNQVPMFSLPSFGILWKAKELNSSDLGDDHAERHEND